MLRIFPLSSGGHWDHITEYKLDSYSSLTKNYKHTSVVMPGSHTGVRVRNCGKEERRILTWEKRKKNLLAWTRR